MMRDIFINSNLNTLTKLTSSSRSSKFKDLIPWNISQMILKTIPISMRIVISYAMKQGILFWKVNGNQDNMIKIPLRRESHWGTSTSIRGKKSNNAGLWMKVRDPKTISISMRIDTSYVTKQGILFWVYWNVNGNWDNSMIRISQWKKNHCRTNTSIRRKKSKRAGLWESQSGLRVGKLTISVRSFGIEKLQKSSPGLSVPPE